MGVDSSTAGPAQDGISTIYWMEEWDPNRPLEQARTTIFWEDDRIVEADMRLNKKNFSFYTDEFPRGAVHLESLVVHELGHVLGLKHNEGGGSVMHPILASYTVRDEIGDPDVDSLRCEYR